jgi:hypothetical protein
MTSIQWTDPSAPRQNRHHRTTARCRRQRVSCHDSRHQRCETYVRVNDARNLVEMSAVERDRTAVATQ